jgi:two-component system CheB/CheR fusion protein
MSEVPTARLLLVEDDQDSLDLFTMWLSGKYRVFSYRCPLDAVNALETARPDLLILDIGISPIDGVQCLKAIRGVPGYSSIPAIAVTGYARDSEQEAFRAAGFQAVVTKPVLDDALLGAIAAALIEQRSDQASAGAAA